MLSWGNILIRRKHLVWTPKITAMSFSAFTFYNRLKQRYILHQCASVKQWLTNHLWGKECSLTYFFLLSPLRKLGNFETSATNGCHLWFCPNQKFYLGWLNLPKGACLLLSSDQWTRVNELESINLSSDDSNLSP